MSRRLTSIVVGAVTATLIRAMLYLAGLDMAWAGVVGSSVGLVVAVHAMDAMCPTGLRFHSWIINVKMAIDQATGRLIMTGDGLICRHCRSTRR
jgi:membrane protein YdbS with pleckstrin-like domain